MRHVPFLPLKKPKTDCDITHNPSSFPLHPIQYDIHIHEKRRVVVIASIHYTLTEERNKRPIFVYVNLDRWALLSPSSPPSGQTFFPLSAATLINASALHSERAGPTNKIDHTPPPPRMAESESDISILSIRVVLPCSGFIVVFDDVAHWEDHFYASR